MSFSEKFIKAFKSVLPAPFTIAVALTVVTWCLAFFLGGFESKSITNRFFDLAIAWEQGVWHNGLLVFALQMMLMLVLGHTLALTQPIDWLIQKALKTCTNSANSAATVVFLTMLVALFNWGLGLIFGAIFARKVAEKAQRENLEINYPLIGAAGYAGLMVWHGGISGSSLTKVVEQGHLASIMKGIYSETQLASLPEQISFHQTVFSPLNLTVSVLLLTLIPTVLYIVGKRTKPTQIKVTNSSQPHPVSEALLGAEKLDHSNWLGIGFGLIVLLVAGIKLMNGGSSLAFFTPNNINLTLLGLGLLMHQKVSSFLAAIEDAISGVSGILIQFPLYFGIMGMMKSSGLIDTFSAFMVSVSNETTYPIFTLFSAGVVIIYVPSGGGQWAGQGPIIVQAAQQIGVGLPKSIMALAYGDQVTNMLQPFWALPLLGITGLKAKEILPYTLLLFLLGSGIFVLGLLIF
jgi:short-chain fatty acids transporter